MVVVDDSSLQADSQTKSVVWSKGRRPLGAVLHSSNELSELSQWPCSHDDSTINIVLDIIIIITFPPAGHHCSLASTKFTALWWGHMWEEKTGPGVLPENDLLMASPVSTPCHQPTLNTQGETVFLKLIPHHILISKQEELQSTWENHLKWPKNAIERQK